jgi:hypothetical protein
MITWLSTKSPIGMLDYRIDRDMADYLHSNRGIDSALLAIDLGLGSHDVEASQRRLGLRKFSVPGRRKL